MKYSSLSPEQAAALARRDRNRLIGFTLGVVVIGGLYLYATWDSRRPEEPEMATPDRAPDAAPEQTVKVVPFGRPEVLAQIEDATLVQQEFLETEPLSEVFAYARLQTGAAFEALGLHDLDQAAATEILAAPHEHRLDALLLRGEIVAVSKRARLGSQRTDWFGTIRSADGTFGHFLVAGAPKQDNGAREIRLGDYLRIDGLFHAVYKRPVDVDGETQSVAAPLILGPRAVPSMPEMTAEIARLLPTLGSVEDDTVGRILDEKRFELAQWELMGRAKMLGEETDWEHAPELNSEVLRAIYEDGDAYRGKPFTIPVSINLDAYSVRVDDNPLRIDRMTIGWIGNNNWNSPVRTIKWIGPFTRRDLMRVSYEDGHRYVKAKAYFFRNHVFSNESAQPIRSPVFVIHELETFTPVAEWSVDVFYYAIFGGTIVLVFAIFFLLRADRRRSMKLHDDLVRRRRARQGQTPEPA